MLCHAAFINYWNFYRVENLLKPLLVIQRLFYKPKFYVDSRKSFVIENVKQSFVNKAANTWKVWGKNIFVFYIENSLHRASLKRIFPESKLIQIWFFLFFWKDKWIWCCLWKEMWSSLWARKSCALQCFQVESFVFEFNFMYFDIRFLPIVRWSSLLIFEIRNLSNNEILLFESYQYGCVEW